MKTKTQEDAVITEALNILYSRMQHRGQQLSSPQDVQSYLPLQLAQSEREIFAVILLNSQHCVIGFEELFYGTIDATAVYPREVVKLALARNAAALILAHNHPSGIAEPSEADKRITTRLTEALSFVDIRVLDHMIVGSNDIVSFAERGLL